MAVVIVVRSSRGRRTPPTDSNIGRATGRRHEVVVVLVFERCTYIYGNLLYGLCLGLVHLTLKISVLLLSHHHDLMTTTNNHVDHNRRPLAQLPK